MEAINKQTKLKLNNGREIPILGLGTWQSKPGQVYEIVKLAIKIGYRHFDCAFAYRNEAEVGSALKEAIDSGVVKREDLFITSKLWNTYHKEERVSKCLEKTLKDLQLDYLDLYLVHWPHGYQEGDEPFPKDENGNVLVSDIDYIETWRGMEKALESGKVKTIGISNFNSKQIMRLFENCKIKPAVNQVECHPYLNQSKLIQFCAEHNIVVTAYSPLGSPGRPSAKDDDPNLLQDENLKKIAENHKKTIAQILIRYQIQRKVVVIPKTANPTRLEENFNVFDFELSSNEMEIINSINRNCRFVSLKTNGPFVTGHKYYPFNEEF